MRFLAASNNRWSTQQYICHRYSSSLWTLYFLLCRFDKCKYLSTLCTGLFASIRSIAHFPTRNLLYYIKRLLSILKLDLTQ